MTAIGESVQHRLDIVNQFIVCSLWAIAAILYKRPIYCPSTVAARNGFNMLVDTLGNAMRSCVYRSNSAFRTVVEGKHKGSTKHEKKSARRRCQSGFDEWTLVGLLRVHVTAVRDQEFQEHSSEASPGPAFQTNELCNLQSAFEADLRLHRDPANLAQKNVEVVLQNRHRWIMKLSKIGMIVFRLLRGFWQAPRICTRIQYRIHDKRTFYINASSFLSFLPHPTPPQWSGNRAEFNTTKNELALLFSSKKVRDKFYTDKKSRKSLDQICRNFRKDAGRQLGSESMDFCMTLYIYITIYNHILHYITILTIFDNIMTWKIGLFHNVAIQCVVWPSRNIG